MHDMLILRDGTENTIQPRLPRLPEAMAEHAAKAIGARVLAEIRENKGARGHAKADCRSESECRSRTGKCAKCWKW